MRSKQIGRRPVRLLLGALVLLLPRLQAEEAVSTPRLAAELADALRQTVASIAATGERLRACAAQATARENQLRDIAVKTAEAEAKWREWQRQEYSGREKWKALPKNAANADEIRELESQLKTLQANSKEYGVLVGKLRAEEKQRRTELEQQQECAGSNEKLLKGVAARASAGTVAGKPVPK